MKKFLIRHLGNMGDAVFFLPPILAAIKEEYPDCHITLVTAWGYKERRRRLLIPWQKYDFWGSRNQSGFSLHLFLTNPHVDQLIHWHDTTTDLSGSLCQEDGHKIPTWSAKYYGQQKSSGTFDEVFELDMGITHTENPLKKLFAAIKLPHRYRGDYKLYFTDKDQAVAKEVMDNYPSPRIVLLEGIEGATTRGWDAGKVKQLASEIEAAYGTPPLWFGSKHTRTYQGRALTLRENIATLLYCDAAIGVLSGPMHFAAATGVPTITLMADQPLHRAAPAYFLNQSITNPAKRHRTLLGPTNAQPEFLKHDQPSRNLTPNEAARQGHGSWLEPGRQATKTPLAAITVNEVMLVLADILKHPVL